MSKFSIVIITLNEEANIGRCLSSVIGLTDDIIIVDSGSTDKTAEICKLYSTRFEYRSFDDYSSQKNYGNDLAKYDYVLSIDADELLSDELKKSILEVNLDANNRAFKVNRLNHHCGKPIRFGGWYPDTKIRLWNRKYGKWVGKIHEYIEYVEKPVYMKLSGDLLHYTYTSREQHIKQAEKFSKLNAERDFAKKRKSNLFILYFTAFFRFFSVYLLKFGFLEGSTGFFIAKITARATFLRNKQLLDLNRKENVKKK
jgi:(heptosyl)LPS beta-1,4-glucosyltransferase